MKKIKNFDVHDLESIRLLLRGGSIVDWHQLNLSSLEQAKEILEVLGFDLEREEDLHYLSSVRDESIAYLRRTLNFPVPTPIRIVPIPELLSMAKGRGHRQICACSVLKVMNIIHYLKAQELKASLPLSEQEIFSLVDEKVYRVIGNMIAAQFPIKEFMGGRKHRDGQYTKLLAKPDNIAARIYDKIRFRLITWQKEDIFPMLNFLLRQLIPFNYVIPKQSTNTLFPFRSYVESNPYLKLLSENLQLPLDLDGEINRCENSFSDPEYRVVHFVVNLPVRIDTYLKNKGIDAQLPGPMIFSLTEFQIVDQETDTLNEQGAASHAAYKERQREAVEKRLKLGLNREGQDS